MKIEIPIKSHLYKYFIIDKQQPWKLSLADKMGIWLYGVLSKPLTDRSYDESIKKYRSTLIVQMSIWQGYDLGLSNELTSFQVVMFNKMIEKDFNKDFFHYVQTSTLVGVTRTTAITRFMDYYNIIDSDITFDALKKKIDRSGKFKKNYKKNQIAVCV